MGATLSKLWVSVRAAWTGGTAAGKNTQQEHQQANGQFKDIESITYTPKQTTEISHTMPGVKQYEIKEVCQLVVFRCDTGGAASTPLRSCSLIVRLASRCEKPTRSRCSGRLSITKPHVPKLGFFFFIFTFSFSDKIQQPLPPQLDS
jgi:hypothetical protein